MGATPEQIAYLESLGFTQTCESIDCDGWVCPLHRFCTPCTNRARVDMGKTAPDGQKGGG